MEKSTSSSPFSGKAKVLFCEKLGPDWKTLADLIEIKPSEQAKFDKGYEPSAIWEWLERNDRLCELPGLLQEIDRGELAETLQMLLKGNSSVTPYLKEFYGNCIKRWSDPRYALDTRFVDLTLLLDQGADAQGPRWQVKSEPFKLYSKYWPILPNPWCFWAHPAAAKVPCCVTTNWTMPRPD